MTTTANGGGTATTTARTTTTEAPTLENGGLVVLDRCLMDSLALAEGVYTDRAKVLQSMLNSGAA